LPRSRHALAAVLIVLAVAVFGQGAAAHASAPVVHRPDLLREFRAAGTIGTMVVRQLGRRSRTVVVGDRRASLRIPPSSTFKVANALIALDRGVATGPDQVFPGPHEQIEVDDQPLLPESCLVDVTLQDALRQSCVSVFQEIAREVGLTAYREASRRLDYGNRQVGAAVDRFWLDGPLAISAHEQVRFLDRLRLSRLPYGERDMAVVRDMLLIEREDGHRLYAKTGYVFTTAPRRGWWVGWVRTADMTSVFALNLDVTRPEHLAARTEIGRAILRELGAFG